MNNPVQINNDEQDTVEMPIAEYEAIVQFTTAIAEQNAAVLGSFKALQDQMVAGAENLAAMFASLVDAVRNVQINVHVPEQTLPAPVVNVTNTMPEQPAAQVTMKMPPDKKRDVNIEYTRDRDGRISGAKGKIE